MINNYTQFTKIILVIAVVFVLGIFVYTIMLKKSSPIVPQPTPSPTLSPTVTPAPTPDNNISGWKTYRNNKYGYELKYPQGWRIATEYMNKLSEISKTPKLIPEEANFIVLTKLTLTEEKEFLEFAEKERGIALSPYFNFGLGKTITILPLYGNKENLYKEINDSIVIKSSNIRDVILNGITITRYRRYEATDNGEFDYESALFPYNNINNIISGNNKKYNYIEVRIERNNGNFEENIFDQMLSTIKFIGNTDVSDWNIYRNDKNGFEIKYSQNPEWVAEESKIINPEAIKPIKSIINFYPKNKVYLKEESRIDPIVIIISNGSLNDYYKVYPKSKDVIEEKVEINNLSFTRQLDTKWGVVSLVVEYPKKNLSFIITNYIDGLALDVSEKNSLEDIFTKMLSTFKFIE